jgi:NTE family protein
MKAIFLFLLFPVCVFCQQNYPYKNLVLEGGGVRGLAYAGALSALEEKGVLNQIEKVAGSSAGSIAALMLCVGYSAKEIDSIMFELPVEEFNDGRYGVVGKYNRVVNEYGIYKGEKFEKWLLQLVKQKTGKADLSFAELHQLVLKKNSYKELYCTGTNISKQQLEIFSFEQTPNMPIALAVRISGGVPLYFEPVPLTNTYKKITKKDSLSFVNYFVDGGMLCNYPISIFDTCQDGANALLCNAVKFNTQTLGIKMERPEQIDSLQKNSIAIPSYTINKFSDYLSALSNLMMEALNRKYPNLENEKGRTIYISQGNIHSRVRKVMPAEKQLLFDNGLKAARDFLSKSNSLLSSN